MNEGYILVFFIHWQNRHERYSRRFLRNTIIPALRRMKGQHV